MLSFAHAIYSTKEYVCLYQEANQLMNALDETFRGFFRDFNSDEYHIPTLINGDVLKKCGYFSSFPHQISVVSYISAECRKHVMESKRVYNNDLSERKQYLTPAACLHIYPMLANDQTIKEKIITTKARVYRFEDEFTELLRLWDFTVREVVFVGSKSFVESKLSQMKEKALVIAKKITKNAKIINGTDSFYPSRHNIIKGKLQKANNQKYELIIPIKNKKVAVSSFNYHHTHFSKPFNFDQNGRIVTGCVGFGMERWIAACLEYNYDFKK